MTIWIRSFLIYKNIYGKQRVLYQGIADWNSLDKSVRDMGSLLLFIIIIIIIIIKIFAIRGVFIVTKTRAKLYKML